MIPDHDVFSMTPVLDKEQKLIEFPSKHSSRRPYQNCHRLPERDLTYNVYVPGTCTGAYKS